MVRATHSKAFGKAFGLAALGAAIAVPLTFTATPVQADTKTTTFNVTAAVMATCKVSVSNLAFGNYDVLSSAGKYVSSTITLTCTKGTPFTIALNAGQYAGGPSNFTKRAMSDGKNPPNLLRYFLYTNSGHTQVWGDGTGNSHTVSGTGKGPGGGHAIKETVYGRLPAAQNAPVGNYTDTINVTVTY